VSRTIDKNMIGIAISIALFINGIRDPLYMTFIKSKGIHPTGEVFLIIKDKDIKLVRITTFLSNLSLTYKK
jgi:hypothetical protein